MPAHEKIKVRYKTDSSLAQSNHTALIMHRLQSYWIATLLIVCLVVDFQPYKVSATPVETTTAVRLSLYVIHSEVSLLD